MAAHVVVAAATTQTDRLADVTKSASKTEWKGSQFGTGRGFGYSQHSPSGERHLTVLG
jgi:hypothetical protein